MASESKEPEMDASVKVETIETCCCVVGGGPAGVMLGYLLARAGVDVLVLEKHKDFFRDFRGDTIHPSTLELMHELGLLDEFLQQPHQEIREIRAYFGNKEIHIADFSHLSCRCKFVALMPQWDFLNFLANQARRYPGFKLRMEAEVAGLLMADQQVVGVSAKTPAGKLEVRADLVVGADGRASIVREQAGLQVIEEGVPIDVLWFRLSKQAKDPPQAFGFVGAGQFMVLIDRANYWQCAYVIKKDSFEGKRQRGLPALREEVGRCTPFVRDRMIEVKQWDDVKLLSVKVDHLRQWYREGLLCLGDSAHAMSPVGGVGINLAVQDAVAAANILSRPLRERKVTLEDLDAVQKRRESPARKIQRLQTFIHQHVLQRIFEAEHPIAPPFFMKLLEKFPRLRRIPARVIGIGFRPEHVKSKPG